jgi:hypothetical protein
MNTSEITLNCDFSYNINNNSISFLLSYPIELLDAYEKYSSGTVFSEWIKKVSKYTTFYYETDSYYTVNNYYTLKDNIIATVTSKKFKL